MDLTAINTERHVHVLLVWAYALVVSVGMVGQHSRVIQACRVLVEFRKATVQQKMLTSVDSHCAVQARMPHTLCTACRKACSCALCCGRGAAWLAAALAMQDCWLCDGLDVWCQLAGCCSETWT